MAYEYYCTNCGKKGIGSSGSGPMSGSVPPAGWKWKWGSTKVFCSSKCKDEYKGRNEASFTASSASEQADLEATARANVEKARVKLEKERLEEEMALLRKQQELEEKKQRQQRADELRAQGKSTHAFFVEYGTAVGAVAFILAVGLFIGYLSWSDTKNAQQGAEINSKLELIEDQIKMAIQEGDRDKALELANQLVHPLHEQWKDQSKFDTWEGYPYYDEWWSKRRQEYKDQIMTIGGKH